MRLAVIAIVTLTSLYLLAVLALFLQQGQMQFYPTTRAPTPAEAGFADATEHILTATDGTRIILWHAPAPPGAPTVLYFHGKGGEIADRPQRWAAYRAAGLGTAFLSYRGYGGSQGSPSEAGFHLDAEAAHDWLLTQGIPAKRIVAIGESLGTGVAVRLAADRPMGALLLEAPYTSVADVAALRYPWAPVHLLIRDPFPSLDRIPRVTAPLLIQHGTADPSIPSDMGERLFAAATSAAPKELILRPGLNHLQLFGPETWAAEIAFIRRVLPNE